MIEKIGRASYVAGKASSSLPCIKNLVKTQQSAFPEYDIDWQGIITTWAAEDADPSRGPFIARRFHNSTFKYLVRATIEERLSSLGVEKWRKEIQTDVDGRCWFIRYREGSVRLIYSKLAHYERLSKLKEAASLLELALWKTHFEDSIFTEKDICRIKCGSNVVVPNVLSFL
mmetsp:Transcript_6325/g.15739  ORF Transcript_6325/g.15739 Transcript_6325/m.15739 type:complete len:172 (+) Transcript_6325:3-518(+)